jgi:glycosyltransferase involved in cell wall biosynthesis
VSKIKLSILTRFYPPDFAPTGQLIAELVEHLWQQGHFVEVFTGRPGYAFTTKSAPHLEDTSEYRLKRSRTSNFLPERVLGKIFNGLFFFLRSALHLLKAVWFYDLVMLTTEPPYLPILGYLVNRVTGFPYVCLLYDIYPDVVVGLEMLKPSNPLVRFWRWLNHKTWERAQAIIVLSPSMQKNVLAQCPQVSDKTFVIHSWCDTDLIRPIAKSENWFVQKHGLGKKFTVLYSGNLGRCHEMETILGTIQILKDDPVEFVFVGGGTKQKSLSEKLQALGLKNCVFLPYQEKTDLAYSLSAADLALVSLDKGMDQVVAPSKLYGLLAAGRPIAAICEPTSYLREILNDAQCGVGIDIGDANHLAEYIRYLIKSPGDVEAMGALGRAYCLAHFTLNIIGEEYLNVLCTAASSGFQVGSSPIATLNPSE